MGSFDFAFNDPKYSDRLLRLIVSDARRPGSSNGEACRSLKRRRCDSTSSISTISTAASEALCEPVTVLAESVVSEGDAAVRETEDRHVNSVILAKESLFFRRIFDGECFKEAKEKVIAIHLRPEEKAPFVDMLQFIYSSQLTASSAEEVAAVWLLAQRFLVCACAEHCLQLLHAITPTVASCTFFLDLASVVDQTVEVRGLMERNVAFLARHFTSATVMNGENPGRWDHLDDFKVLPLAALEYLLASDLLQAVHEEAVFHALRVWTKVNCKAGVDEREAWIRFGPLVRWPLIETPRLKALLSSPEAQYVHELLVEALVYKACTEEEQRQMSTEAATRHHRFRRRERHALPVKCVAMDVPLRTCHDGKRRVSIGLVTLNAPQSPLRIDITVCVWDARSASFVQRYKGAHTVRKEVRERIAMCLDCFGKDLDEILTEKNGYLFKNATWFKAEVQVDMLDKLGI